MPDKFDHHCRLKRMKLRQDEDWVSNYDGREGSGKSNAAIIDGFGTSKELFNHREHVCYDPEEYLRLIDDVPRYGTIILDEAGEAFFSRSFRDEMNVSIAKTLQQMRFRNLNVIFCVPHKDYIDLIGRVRVKTWVHLDANRRGRAEFMVPLRSKYYSRDEPYWKTLFFYQFNALPKRIYEEYKEVKIRKSKERLGRYIDEIERKREKYKDNKPDIEQLIADVRDKDEFRNSRGRYDIDLIRYGKGIPAALAANIAKRLNSSNLFPS